jgi:hypothetical protein
MNDPFISYFLRYCLFIQDVYIEREGMEIFLGTCGNENIASRPVRVVCNT